MNPYPNAITDQSIVPYPKQPPTLGAAGTFITDPFCGNNILRVTDEHTHGGDAFTSDSSSEATPWSSDSKHFTIIDVKTGGRWLYEMAESLAGLACHQVGAVPYGQFASKNPAWLVGATDLSFEAYDIHTKQKKVIVNLRDYPELGIPQTPRWYLNSIAMGAADQRVCANLGPGQDQNTIVVVWDEAWGLCWLKTDTGEYGGWQTSGILPKPTPFRIHDTRISSTANCIKIGPQGLPQQSMAFWQPGSPTFQLLNTHDAPILGHTNMGFSHYYGGRCATHPFEWLQAPLFALQSWSHLYTPGANPTAYWSDYHISVQPDPNDRNPLLISTENVQHNPSTPGTPLTSLQPGDNEILAVAADGSGKWWRLAHHYSSAKHGFYSTPRGNVSPNGKYFLFTSDWQSTLTPRTDVFLLKLF